MWVYECESYNQPSHLSMYESSDILFFCPHFHTASTDLEQIQDNALIQKDYTVIQVVIQTIWI